MTQARLCRVAIGFLTCGALLVDGGARAQDTRLLDAVRRDDAGSVEALLPPGADTNVGDELGATPLMWAAAVGSAETLQRLLDRGADANVASRGGGTALMWATGDLAKVQRLLDHGADVNARMTDGTTALAAAARRDDVEVMRELVLRGFDPGIAGVGVRERAELLRIAHGTRPDMVPLLAEVGITLDALAGAVTPSLANYPGHYLPCPRCGRLDPP